jgi:hypothetical protein
VSLRKRAGQQVHDVFALPRAGRATLSGVPSSVNEYDRSVTRRVSHASEE